jgi:peptidoglycan/LPS O-acetylase OafA/YrhL
VFFCHSFATKNPNILSNEFYNFVKNGIFANGYLGVNFFFVLSGFLITYLLLVEKDSKGKVHIGMFYIRRILKIWPVYYLCIAIGFLAFPVFKSYFGGSPNETANPLYYIFLVNNFDYIRHGTDSSTLAVLWSIAVEEQFYLVWPLIIAFTNKKYLPYVFYTIIAGSFVFRCFYYDNGNILVHHTFSCISDMTVGGLSAYYILYSEKFKTWVQSITGVKAVTLYVSVAILYFFRQYIFIGYSTPFERLIFSIVFALVILNQNYTLSNFKVGKLKTISKMGQYTYGLYCYHMIGILVAHTLLLKFGFSGIFSLMVVEFTLSLVLSILIAMVSFRFFEKPFLSLKERFQIVKTKKIDLVIKDLQPLSEITPAHKTHTK